MRLLTRSDFDGLACGALLKSLGIVDSWMFVHPKDMQDGKVVATEDDVLANVPFVPGCGMWFDHHASELERLEQAVTVKGECRLEKSCARVIYDYYNGAEKLPNFSIMVDAVDKVDAGLLTREEILRPEGWVLLGFIMDPRTGLGRFREFSISNYQLMEKLIDFCATMNIGDILELPDVTERVELYFDQADKFIDMVYSHTHIDGNVIVSDLRGQNTIFAGNRFLVYSLFPEQNVSVWVVDGRGKINCPIAVGYSILNRTCSTDIGAMLLQYGGGGHRMVGTCQVPYEEADKAVAEIVTRLREDEEKRAAKA